MKNIIYGIIIFFFSLALISNFISAEECKNKIGSDTIFSGTVTLPQYPGGIDSLMKYLISSIEYPTNAQNKKIKNV